MVEPWICEAASVGRVASRGRRTMLRLRCATTAATRAGLLAAGRRRLCGTAASPVRDAVLRIAEQQGGGSSTDLDADLNLKFELLTACEREFGLHMSHKELNDVRTVDDAAKYWIDRIAGQKATQEAEEQHWSRVHPPNVQVVDRESVDSLNDWLATHASEPTPVWERQQMADDAEDDEADDDAEPEGEDAEIVDAAQADRSKVPF